MQLVTMIQKAKRLVKNGVVPESEFKEVKIAQAGNSPFSQGGCVIELAMENGRLIRFCAVEQLVDFLKKAA
jgi:hypothetical protein